MATFTFLGAKFVPEGHIYDEQNPPKIIIRKSDGSDWEWQGMPDATADATDSRVLNILRADTEQWEEVV